MNTDKTEIEAVLTLRGEDGFYRTEITRLIDYLERPGEETELDVVCLEFDTGIIFGFIRYDVSDEKLGFDVSKDSDFGKAAIAVANDMELENDSHIYDFAGVKTLMYY